ncbi:MAG: HD domain-containing protein [Candidatus Zixiibacteriota bacterium]|nr:MAG: HD domain-containing protein [candidate division Zixibacteria bacterium]
MMMEAKRIKDLVKDDRVEGFFAVRRADVREYARGQFVSMELGDSSGRIQAVLWEPDQFALKELAAGMVVKLRGHVGEYKDKPQISVQRMRLAEDDEYTLEEIMPHSSFTPDERRARLVALRDKVENLYIRNLIAEFFNDQEFMIPFLNAAAGKLWHHAYIGGLAEHSANVAELALRVATGYPFLDKDYLLFGGLFHDAGKMATYSTETVLEYTDEGRLIGHISLADEWVCQRAGRIENFPDKLLVKLRHLLLAHHGAIEYASPVVPQMPEAFVLYYCDEIDSKMGAIERIRNKHDGQGWSEYVRLLDRFLYFGDGKGDSEG